VTSGKVRAVIEAGARDIEAVGRACGAGTGCGHCHGTILSLLEAVVRDGEAVLSESGVEIQRPTGVLVVAIYPVPDFEAWKAVLDAGRQRRAGYGALRHWVYQAVDEPNEVMVAVEVDSLEHAEAMLEADNEMREWLDKAGVDIYPAIFVGAHVESAVYS
jgi:bacterioferritin-associated ferredoxin